MKVLALLSVLWAVPVAAQELTYSNDATRFCVRDRAVIAEQMTCIGASANACMEASPGGFSTVGMAGCLDRERAHWDTRLNRVYTRLREQERAVGLEDELQAMQRAWITYRDTRCAYEAGQFGGGTGAGPATVRCLMQVTAEQTLYLRSMLR